MKKAKFEKFMAKQFLKRLAFSSLEVEQKYRVTDIHPVRRSLKKMGAKLLASGQEHNELYDDNKRLRKKKQILRLRYHGESRAWMTFKGPRLKGRYKKRVEIETPVSYEEAKRILVLLGFRMMSVYRKHREEYKVAAGKVYLDYLPKIGWFVEIEAMAGAIRGIARKLGLGSALHEHRSYRRILEDAAAG